MSQPPKATCRLQYNEVINPRTPVELMKDPQIESSKVELVLNDGVVRMATTDAVFNLLFWQPYAMFGVPIQLRHLIPRPHINSKKFCDILTKIHDELMVLFPDRLYDRKEAIFQTINNIYNFISEELGEYVDAFDVLDIAKIMTQEPFLSLMKEMNIRPGMSPDVIERKIKTANNKLQGYLETPGALANDAMLYFQTTKSLNPLQLSQMFLTFGLRTDIDDTLVLRPVKGSAISGLQDVLDYAVEALAGIKPVYYLKVGVRTSQYMNRKQQIVASSMSKIYPNDCGTPHTVDFMVTELNYQTLEGKYYVVGNELRVFRYVEDAKEYCGKMIKLRSPMVCRHRDGCCQVCGGLLTINLHPQWNIGLLAAMTFVQRVTQAILSAKHLIQTISQIYQVPSPANKYFISGSVEADKVRWNREIDSQVSNWHMGVTIKDFMPGAFSDPSVLKKITEAREAMFGRIRSVVLRDNKTGKTITLPLQVNNQSPFFTKTMLEHIRIHYKELQHDEFMVWIPMAGTEDLPLMSTTIINDNILEFVRLVDSFLRSKIASYTSCADVLQVFSNLVYSKAPTVNLMYLEILLRAYQITDGMDCRIPEITDPNSVRFSTTSVICSRRSIGQLLAYQGLKQHLRTLLTYLSPVGNSVFDIFVGLFEGDNED